MYQHNRNPGLLNMGTACKGPHKKDRPRKLQPEPHERDTLRLRHSIAQSLYHIRSGAEKFLD